MLNCIHMYARLNVNYRSNSQCWRVVGEAERNDRLIRATLQDITPEVIRGKLGHFSCEPLYSSIRSGLLIYDGMSGFFFVPLVLVNCRFIREGRKRTYMCQCEF